jgi:hypothetical protein
MKKKLLICFVFLASLLFLASVSFALAPGLEMEQNEQNEMMLDNHFTGILAPASINNSTVNRLSLTIMDTNALSATIMTKEIIKVP